MGYFDGIQKMAKQLTQVAQSELDSQMEFRSKLSDTYNRLKDDYKKEDINDAMDDEIFFDDFAHEFGELIDDLVKECERVMRGTKRRKEELRHALIWGSDIA